MNETVWLNSNAFVCREALVILNARESKMLFDETEIDPIKAGGYEIAPWGVENDLPQQVMSKIDKSEIVGTNANFNWKVMAGTGVELVELIRDHETNRPVKSRLLIDGPAYDWFVRNNVTLLLMEILTDVSYFGNAFPVLIIGEKGQDRISGIRHREAMFSRWAIDKDGNIIKHLYSGKWDGQPKKQDIEESYVIDEYNAYNDIEDRIALRKDKRLCFPIYIPSPGRPYYSYPVWWSIFRSGWYDNVISIPALKKALLKYKLGVKHIIYISEAYFNDKEEMAKIPKSDIEGRKALRDKLVKEISGVLAGESNAGRSITSLKKLMPNGSGMNEEKYIEIQEVKNDIDGGEYLTDYESGANLISYAMEVHPSLIGATPGKNSNSLSGSNIREIFIMKQSLSKPIVQLALQWWPFVRKVNGWNPNIEIVIKDSLFTTLDQNKSGEIKTENNVTQ